MTHLISYSCYIFLAFLVALPDITVGERVGIFVGFEVGERVGFFVGFAVGAEVEMQLRVVSCLLLLRTFSLIQSN
jgi:uncharacterized membrane protein (Fun14 family)